MGQASLHCVLMCMRHFPKHNNLTRSELYTGEMGNPYNTLYWEAPPERGTFFSLQVYERVGISLVEAYERVGKSVISFCKKVQKG